MNEATQPGPLEVRLSDQLGRTEPEHTIWYEACNWGTPTIRAVRVLRETAHQVVLADCTPGNARRAKANTYFPTWAEAHAHMLRMTQRELDAARVALARAQGRHGNVKGMRPNGMFSRSQRPEEI